MKKHWPIVVLIGFTLGVVGCNDSRGIALSLSKTSRQVKMLNDTLEHTVLAKLRSDSQLGEERSLLVKADASKNLIILAGTVSSDDAKTKAVGVARSARAGLTIDNQIEVRPIIG